MHISKYLMGIKIALLFGLIFFTKGFAQQSKSDYEISQREVKVEMPDGTKLWGCLTYPEAIEEGKKFPALLVYDPYAGQCSLTYYYEGPQAKKGYVVGYFHIRGSGLSEGTFFEREYSEQELDDAVHLIDWLANQPWSTGNVGMYGWSWSGFNALQVAMKQPKALKAIIANVATENLYHGDVHYADGIFRFGTYNLFADLNLIYTPPPLDPSDESLLANRFDQPPLSLNYLKHQTDGPFWRKFIRLNNNPDTLSVPTYLMGGWYDGYRSAIDRTLANAKVPAKAIIGPWTHSLESPQPTADLPKLMTRWWDYWLKNKDTGVMKDPDLITYLRAPYLPTASTDSIPGRWQGVDKWPNDKFGKYTYYLATNNNLKTKKSDNVDSLQLRYIPTSGTNAGIWWGDVRTDQRSAEAHSLSFETDPFKKEKSMLGRPEIKLWVSTSASHANWIVRLSDVAPDGTLTRITGAAQNGSHRNSSSSPSPLEPFKKYELTFPLHFTSWIVKPGHKLRVSVSNATWPMFWPTSYPMTTSLFLGSEFKSIVTLPFMDQSSDSASQAIAKFIGSRNIAFKENADYPIKDLRKNDQYPGPNKIVRDEANGITKVIYSEADSSANPKTFLTVTYSANDFNPSQASVKGISRIELRKNSDLFTWEGTTQIKSDSLNFYYEHKRTLKKNEEIIRSKTWKDTMERKYQ